MQTTIDFKAYNQQNLNFNVNIIPDRIEPLTVLMCTPEYFDIVDVKNVHMEGKMLNFNKFEAVKQWHNLYAIYAKLKVEGVVENLITIEGQEGCEDMVFCANQTFPWLNNRVVISKMRHASRQKEVPFFEAYFTKLGYNLLHLKKAQMFEGMGDTIPHPGKQLLYGGFGHRTDQSAYHEIAEMLQVPIVTLELPNPNFYHLDTCFVPLSQTDVMLCKEAFTSEGMETISKLFDNLHFINQKEAIGTFCLNAHVIANPKNGKKAAIIQQGSVEAKATLIKTGYTIYETQTSEFIKSGGSVFCMKMMVY